MPIGDIWSPQSFAATPVPEEIESYGHAILHGYQSMDRLLADFFRLEEDGVTLVMATALSQQPFLRYEASGGQRFYRPRNLPALLELVGIRSCRVEPLMAHQYLLRFDDATEQQRSLELISQIRYGQRPALCAHSNGDLSICVASDLPEEAPPDAKITIDTPARVERPFSEFFYLIEETKSGYHHPEGVLWFKTGQGRRHEQKVSILDIFPTILDLMDINYSRSEAHPIKGRSLVADWAGVNRIA
jgi:hypothetical protein